MKHSDTQRRTLLIADDSEMNRSMLADILGEEFDILEAADGVEAVEILEKQDSDISAVLLDIVMPRMNGFEVLAAMNQRGWIEEIPVLVISAESGSTQIERAFGLGATDFIMRPFDALLVYRRVINTVLLYAKQKKLLNFVIDQIDEKERNSRMMVDILSQIVEFHNGESGQHIIHVRTFTEVMLRQLQRLTDRYPLSQADIALISMVSALHDIGKIAVDEKILNKPGRLTPEEFEEMKRHSIAGAQMLESLSNYRDAKLVRMAWEICRWHHERYDGGGYPDGLVGDAIPISAQVVALADVYDALISERCYKKAIPHEKAVQMILNGECGVFNPLLMDCLREVEGTLSSEFGRVQSQEEKISRMGLVQELLGGERLFASERSLRLMEQERRKNNLLSNMTNEISFEYSVKTGALRLSELGAKRLGIDEVLFDPMNNPQFKAVLPNGADQQVYNACRAARPDQPMVTGDYLLHVGGQPRWHRLVIQTLWSEDEIPCFVGLIGKAMDIHSSRTQLNELEKQATHDAATGLMNHASAKAQILRRFGMIAETNFALVIFDLDHLKQFNDTYGHLAGNDVLKGIADHARQCVRGDDIVARIGGDEFLLLLSYQTEVDGAIDRIFNAIRSQYRDKPVTVSMGVAKTKDVGYDYDTLFHAADKALYVAKRSGRDRYVFYDDSMSYMLSENTVPTTGEEENS